MYKELIRLYAEDNPNVQIRKPCPAIAVRRAERKVGCRFPEELKEFLGETDGDNWMLWSAREIITMTMMIREEYRPMFVGSLEKDHYKQRVSNFLFFGTSRQGDYYCYRVPDGKHAETKEICLWQCRNILEECCWVKAADSLPELVKLFYGDPAQKHIGQIG